MKHLILCISLLSICLAGCGSVDGDVNVTIQPNFYILLKLEFSHAILVQSGFENVVFIDNINPPYGVSVSWHDSSEDCKIIFHSWNGVDDWEIIKQQDVAIGYLHNIKSGIIYETDI